MLFYTRSKKPALIFFLALIGVFFVIAVAITIFGLSDRIHAADVLVVLGNQVDPNGLPSPRLQARLDKAIQLYQQGTAPRIIVSGGIEPNGYDEALVMKSYLAQHNVPEENIVIDNQGNDTYSSAQHVSIVMAANGWQSAVVVSQFYHLARSTFAFEQYGIPEVYSAHPDFFEPRDVYSLGREVVAFIAYRMRPYK